MSGANSFVPIVLYCIVTEASCEKSVAVKALKENDGDLVNAIMSLTT